MRDELDKAKAEMINKDVAIATLEKQLRESAAELEAVTLELKERDVAIATLESELELAAAGDKQLNLFPPELTPIQTPEPVTASPVTEPTPEPKSKVKSKPKTTPEPKSITAVPVFETEPENIKSPAVKPEPLTVTPTDVVQTEIPLLDSIEGTVSVGGLMERIREIKQENPAFPDPPQKTQTFTDAVTGKTNRLGELERLYGFKLVGYVMKGQKREYRYTIN